MTSIQVARQLLAHMGESLDVIEQTCAANGTKLPELNEPFSPPTEAFRADPKVAEAANIASAAAVHLAAILTPPQVTLYHFAGGHFRAAAIRACLESNITEILREAGPEGLHVKDIAAKNGQDPLKLGRFLRFLATNHVYREVSPDVFTNTRISSMLDTLKPSTEIIAKPESKHIGTFGFPAFLSHHLDEAFKAAAWSWEVLEDPKTRKSGDPHASPFSRALNTDQTLWEFYERPEESFRHQRFSIGMHGVQALQPPDSILGAFNWKSLPAESLVVDVGGGIGTSSMSLATHFPQLNIVVQDLPSVIEEGRTIWAEKHPDAIKSGRVQLEAHDFFKPQPHNDASVFLLKIIIHDWSDEFCVKLLARLREAATKDTVLLLIESIMPFACHDSQGDDNYEIPGAVPHEAPAPLLANYGHTNLMGYNADIDMFLLFNSQERTIRHFNDLLRGCGWKVIRVNRHEGGDSTFLQAIEAVPF
ncbi:S-adenosyl-L-methionine-dependent methyltransferase [Stereum hirsutum FP-91666 SS1]|uniref:S-adenosyl-L-methionine-dependent methyltransferase n=1 Tax=Stereum hirsutum (strain FP-91666) TaxID=721885 RepID=UPI000440D450|nr:S-adenosyl-L-methionine-dependent methyltransferase [Stereum hirsutum FP-91666 SS1]EIM90650.1 S-adenosyl-L-methionine-dependent methyltransferase [Stereum hirsutum FP-91666 SS1]